GGLVVGAGALAQDAGVPLVEPDQTDAGTLELAGYVGVVGPGLAGGQRCQRVGGDGVGRLGAPATRLAVVGAEQARPRAAVAGRALESGGGAGLGDDLAGRVDEQRVKR